MPHPSWLGVLQFITDLADEAVLLPFGAAVAIALVAMAWWRGAMAWTGVVASGLAVIVVLKIATGACPALAFHAGVVSPSGHTAASAMMAGGLVGLLAVHQRHRRLLACAAAAGTALIIGATRIGLGAHTVMDVVIAAPLGVGAALLLTHLADQPPPRFRVAGLIAVAVAVAICFHGLHLHAETLIRHIGRSFGCPVG